MLKVCSTVELKGDKSDPAVAVNKLEQDKTAQEQKMEKRARLKQKIIALGKMNNMLGNLREN